MMEHLVRFGKYGLIMASTLLPTITADREREMHFNDKSSDSSSNQTSNIELMSILKNHPLVSHSSLIRFNERIRDVAVDMVRLEYI